MKKHKITLLNGHSGELRVPAEHLAEAISALIEGAQRATRFAVEGESTRPGARPSWLDAVCALDITGVAIGSFEFAAEASTLGHALPAKFAPTEQLALFGDATIDVANDIAIDLFGKTLASVIEDDIDNVKADRPLLASCARFAKLASENFEGIKLANIRGREAPLLINGQATAMIERLLSRTPATNEHISQVEPAGVAAFFGTWPGEESELELLAALESIG